MSILINPLQKPSKILSYIFLSILLISCSENNEEEQNQYDHPHPKSTDMMKHLFEHEFAEQCIAKETAHLINKEAGRERFAEPCLCIATYLFKGLASKESYTLLNDKKQAQSLRKKYKEATGHCL